MRIFNSVEIKKAYTQLGVKENFFNLKNDFYLSPPVLVELPYERINTLSHILEMRLELYFYNYFAYSSFLENLHSHLGK